MRVRDVEVELSDDVCEIFVSVIFVVRVKGDKEVC